MFANLQPESNEFRFNGITVAKDPSPPSTNRKENWLPILKEEQLVLWYRYEPLFQHLAREFSDEHPMQVLDVGCGTGFFSTMTGKHLAAKVIPIDKNAKSARMTFQAIQQNHLAEKVGPVRKEHYGFYSAQKQSSHLIFLNPPSLMYPRELESRIPLYARTGGNGLLEFQNQVNTAMRHLHQGGLIVFVMALGGNGNTPTLLGKNDAWAQTHEIEYQNIMKPTDSRKFLSKLYEGKGYQNFIKEYSNRFSHIHLVSGSMQPKGGHKIPVNSLAREIPAIEFQWKTRREYYRQLFSG